MQTSRSFEIGTQLVNGYTISIERVISAQQLENNSRIAAKYFGTITDPNGTVISLGTNGKTSPQIKRIIGLTTIANNSGDKQLISLKKALKALEWAGLDTTEVAEKIAAREQELQQIATEQQAQNQARKDAQKAIKQQIEKLKKAAKAMAQAGLNCDSITEQIESLKNQLN